MEKEKGKEPETLPDETLDEAAGGLNFTQPASPASFPGFGGAVKVAVGDVNNDGAALKIADGSVKPGA